MTIEIQPQEAISIDEETPADQPPPDVLRAAERLGAFSAGPAPVRLALEVDGRPVRDATRKVPAVTHESVQPAPPQGAEGSGPRKKTKRGRKANA